MPEHPLSLRQTLDGTGHPAHRPLSEIVAVLVRLLRVTAGSICRPRQSQALDNLSDHMLRDIGIESPDAARESTVGFWRRR